jgi:hypothetical protein
MGYRPTLTTTNKTWSRSSRSAINSTPPAALVTFTVSPSTSTYALNSYLIFELSVHEDAEGDLPRATGRTLTESYEAT